MALVIKILPLKKIAKTRNRFVLKKNTNNTVSIFVGELLRLGIA